MKTKIKCPRCETPMDWNGRFGHGGYMFGTLECWKCNKIIPGKQEVKTGEIEIAKNE